MIFYGSVRVFRMYEIMVDERRTAKLKAYAKLYGLKFNPFKHQNNVTELVGKDLALKMYFAFVEAYLRTNMVFYMKRSELEKALVEARIFSKKEVGEAIDKAVEENVLEEKVFNGEKYYGLSAKYSPW